MERYSYCVYFGGAFWRLGLDIFGKVNGEDNGGSIFVVGNHGVHLAWTETQSHQLARGVGEGGLNVGAIEVHWFYSGGSH